MVISGRLIVHAPVSVTEYQAELAQQIEYKRRLQEAERDSELRQEREHEARYKRQLGEIRFTQIEERQQVSAMRATICR